MSNFNKFLNKVDKGLLGENEGIPMGLPKLGDDIGNVLPEVYYLIGAESGVGKTAFVDTAFCINPIDHILSGYTDKTLKIFYFSLEISAERKIAKWCCIYLWKKYRIITDYKTILGMKKSKISDDLYQKIVLAREYFDKVLEFIVFHDEGIHPTGILHKVEDYCKSVGVTKEITNSYNGKDYMTTEYIPNNPKEIVLSIKDHIGLIRTESQLSTKDNLDRNSSYNIYLRNKYRVSSVDISQFNRELSDVNRQRFKEIVPQSNDFKNTGNTFEDAEIVMGLFDPARHGLENYANYDIVRFNGRIKFVQLIKNRDGDDNLRYPLNFLGEAGYYRQMATAEQFEVNPMYYEKAIKFT